MKFLLYICVAAFTVGLPGCKTGLVDTRTNREYKTARVNGLMWMAENMNFPVDGSRFFNDKPENEKISGRVYTWEQARQACPQGWRLPTEKELTALMLPYGKISYSGGDDAYKKVFGPYAPKETALTYFKLTGDTVMNFPSQGRPDDKAQYHRTMVWTSDAAPGGRAFAIYWRAIDEYIDHTSVHFSSYPQDYYGFCRCVKNE